MFFKLQKKFKLGSVKIATKAMMREGGEENGVMRIEMVSTIKKLTMTRMASLLTCLL